jgi:chromosome segregation ATPase
MSDVQGISPLLMSEIERLEAKVARLTAERDEAREFVDEWREAVEAAEKERDEARESIKTLVKEDGVVVSRQAAEVARLRDALREIWDDFCTSHMGDCNCVVCTLTVDALNIDRASPAA